MRKQLHITRQSTQWENLFMLSLDLQCIAGFDGYFKRINPAWTRTLGYTEDELLAEPYLHFVHPDDRQMTVNAAQHASVWGKLLSFENRYQCKDGSYRWLQWTANPSPSEQLVFCNARDITEQKKMEAELIQARSDADRANQAKSEFLSRMSHELRTPLNAILGFGQLLELDALNPEQQQSVRHILKGGQHLLSLINEVLDIAQIEAGRMTLSLEPVPIDTVIGEAVDLVRPQADARKIQLRVPAIGEETVYVRADRQRLKQVLMNLLSNGVKYNRNGGTLTVSYQASSNNRYRITVTDTGAGIPPVLLTRLFTPFDRLGADGNTEGTGLGLVLTRNLMTAMGGTISVDSVVDQGTSFFIDLVTSDPPSTRPAVKSAKIERPVLVPRTTFTVLYIEDNLSNYHLIERLIARQPGVELISAIQGQLGVELAVMHRPDLILLDLNLPDISGEEVLLRLREHPETSTIPVIMLSAVAMPKQIEKLMAAGAKDYLTKPIEVNRFYALLNEMRTKKEALQYG